MKLLPLILAIMFAGQTLFAQEIFKIQNASKKYDLLAKVVDGDKQDALPNYFKGMALINLYRKGNKHPFQILRLPKIVISKENIAFNPKPNRVNFTEKLLVLCLRISISMVTRI